MSRSKLIALLFIILFVSTGLIIWGTNGENEDSDFISYTIDAKSHNIDFFWKDAEGRNIGSIKNLKTYVEGKNQELLFAMNGGMYNADKSPTGLFIQQFETQTPLNRSDSVGNFYMKPNGIFYITANNDARISTTDNFVDDEQMEYATQSGPMLVIDGVIHPAFKEGSKNIQIRNGVGILPDNKIVFAMSKVQVSFYDFADYFKSLGCMNALYLDGYVSRAYLPEKNWMQLDGEFGVIIGVTKSKE